MAKMKELKDMSLQELVNLVAATGMMNTDIESICIMQDIIGHTSVGEVAEIANAEHKEAFYRIYGECYGTVDAIKYYLQNSEALAAKIEAARQEVMDDYNGIIDTNNKMHMEAYTKVVEERNLARLNERQAADEVQALKQTLQEKDAEIIKLKAMLFDYMSK